MKPAPSTTTPLPKSVFNVYVLDTALPQRSTTQTRTSSGPVAALAFGTVDGDRSAVRQDDERIDYDELDRLAEQHKPKMIMVGASAYSRTLDFAAFAEIASAAPVPSPTSLVGRLLVFGLVLVGALGLGDAGDRQFGAVK